MDSYYDISDLLLITGISFSLVIFVLHDKVPRILKLWIAFMSLASFSFWLDSTQNGLFHKIDAIIVRFSIIIFISYKLFWNTANSGLFWILTVILLGFVYLSNHYSTYSWKCRNHIIYHLCAHILYIINLHICFLRNPL
jgi:hypothetical protein